MTFRTRILLACLTVAVAPLALLAAGTRYTVRDRLTEQYVGHVSASSDAARRELSRHASVIEARLRSLARQIVDEPGLRAALLDAGERSALLDLAGDAMGAAGLDYLLLLDGSGRVLSSGHFRNDYDRVLPGLSALLLRADGGVLVSARRPAGGFLALVRTATFDLASRRFTLVGGVEVDSAFVSRLAPSAGDGVLVTLEYPDGILSSAAAPDSGAGVVTEQIPLSFVDGATSSPGAARWSISYSLAPLHAVLRAMDRWFLAAMAAAIMLAFVIARVIAARVNRPLEELARKAGRIELDRYDVQLANRRQDEVGSLARLLDRMVQRLRAGAHQLRDAERRATVGDMARQVNHDIRNGLLPIRNVISHLTEVAHETPSALGSVFAERAGTLHGGITYLESLATNYARLSPRSERQACDVNAILQTVLRDSAAAGDGRAVFEPGASLPPVSADPVALRRVLDNLTINALESLAESGGRVVVRTDAARGADGGVIITIADTGAGIPPDAVDLIFDDFYTTKERGTGLGLSIVRRLLADMGGRIRVHSEPGRGTTFTIELPAAS